jgi:hypothetical protein
MTNLIAAVTVTVTVTVLGPPVVSLRGQTPLIIGVVVVWRARFERRLAFDGDNLGEDMASAHRDVNIEQAQICTLPWPNNAPTVRVSTIKEWALTRSAGKSPGVVGFRDPGRTRPDLLWGVSLTVPGWAIA